jgi:uncharacterized protein
MLYIYNADVGVDNLADFEGFDWDKGNSGKNLKHNVTDGECEEIFFNAPLLFADDHGHSGHERRFAAFGITNAGRQITLVFTMRGSLVRVISARDINRKERGFYKSNEENT